MTGAEIIKGLECCNRADNAVCDDCPYNEYNRVDAHYPYSCQRYLRMDALTLIKLHRERIVALRVLYDNECKQSDEISTKARAEAIREFADKVTALVTQRYYFVGYETADLCNECLEELDKIIKAYCKKGGE